MMDLSKTLQEDIRINQINLKAAIQNHQALVVRLRGGNLADSSEVKLKLVGIQKHILSLGEAQKLLVARVKKELAANGNAWSNHTSDKAERPNAELRVYPSANCIDPARKFNSTYQKRAIREAKAERAEAGSEDADRKRNQDGGGGVCDAPPSKRVKTILHASARPTSPPLHDAHNNYDQGTVPSSSDDSQESLTIDTSSEPSKVDFLSAVGLVNREQLMLAKNKNSARRRRRYAGHHSQYSSQGHWDLTVRRHRPRCGDPADKEVTVTPMSIPITAVPALREELLLEAADEEDDEEGGGGGGGSTAPLTGAMTSSPAILEVKHEQDSASSGCSSPMGAAPEPRAAPGAVNPFAPHASSPPPPLSPDKIVCTVCRKKGILSVCDICSTAFHWFCLDKNKQCPVCLVSQAGAPTLTPFHQGGGNKGASKHPNHVGVTSDEVFTRYYKRVPPTSDTTNHYAERLKVKKALEARNETLKHEVSCLKKKATELSAALVSQTENIKKLTAGEEQTNEKVKKILNIINFFKSAPS